MDKEQTPFTLEYYRLPSGKAPVEEFLSSLNNDMRTKAYASLTVLHRCGNTLKPPLSKSIGGGLFELRIQFDGDISRIFYFFMVNNTIILTNGYIKKTRKAPRAEIERARKYKADYERRHKKHG